VLAPRLGLLSDVGEQVMVDYPLDALVGPLERRRGKQAHERWDTVRRHRAMTYATIPGWRGVLDLGELHTRAVGVLGLTAPVRRLPGVCPARGCRREELRQDQPRYRGDEQPVYCGWCGHGMSMDDYRRGVREWTMQPAA
jgi:hypothetical protein